jgi:hypothetical protein
MGGGWGCFSGLPGEGGQSRSLVAPLFFVGNGGKVDIGDVPLSPTRPPIDGAEHWRVGVLIVNIWVLEEKSIMSHGRGKIALSSLGDDTGRHCRTCRRDRWKAVRCEMVPCVFQKAEEAHSEAVHVPSVCSFLVEDPGRLPAWVWD